LCSDAEPPQYRRTSSYRDLGNAMLFTARIVGLLLLALMAEGCAAFHGKLAAPNIVRQPLEIDDPAFPIAGGVMTRAGTDTVYLAGLLPSVTNPNAPKDSVESYGDAETQTTTILTRIKALLGKFGFDMGDIVKMNIYMVGDPSKGNAMDFEGMMAAYRRYFGTHEQPNKPARTTVQVVALRRPGALMEIEVVAAKKR
jgi:enamine deaminase RidA (YjgF/YER057c/UK114 family)